jgi:2-oxoglutarate ferredoxin oxidoreductase subunit beta
MLEAGATFLARGYTAKIPHLVDLIVQAIEHKGFAFVEVLQPCVSWNNTYELYNKITDVLDREPMTYEEATIIAKKKDKLPLGVIYRTQKPVFHEQLYGIHNPAKNRMNRTQRLEKINKILQIK